MAEIDLKIRSVKISDRPRLANLIHFGSQLHQHLDWISALDWIGKYPFLVLERGENIIASLACPPEIPGITWIRLFVVNSSILIDRAWESLWSATIEELKRIGKFQVAALSLQGWFNSLLENSDFTHTDDVVVLIWDNSTQIPQAKSLNFTIRPMQDEDLHAAFAIDNEAFKLEWRNSFESMESGFQQASIATVAESEGEVVGYQYSTLSNMGGHLARLAVKPAKQGIGIGFSLVRDVLSQFRKNGAVHVTVNTQQKNAVSLSLYKKAGFKSTGESYRVYQYFME
jgi:ribosomal protein S18 acetylase RimI-like enzyme